MSVIAVTGISGTLAQRFLARADADPGVTRVIGIDTAHPPAGSPKLDLHEIDVRDPQLGKVLVGADVLVHLACQHDAAHDPDEARSINLDGTRNVVEAAAATGIARVVHLSTALVYGAHADNDVPLTEASPLRPNEDLAAAVVARETEGLLEALAAGGDGVGVTVLRAATVFGPTADSFLSRMLEAPRLTTVKGYEPAWQVVHEEDVAAAVAFAVEHDLPGTFNLSADGWLSGDEVVQITTKRRVEIPISVAFTMGERLWRAGLTASPPGELHYIMHPWVVDNAKLRAAGWRPRYSNRAALLESMEAHRNWIALGRARVRKDSLAMGTAATLGAIGAMAWVRRARRR